MSVLAPEADFVRLHVRVRSVPQADSRAEANSRQPDALIFLSVNYLTLLNRFLNDAA
jgi:hypothetical protein